MVSRLTTWLVWVFLGLAELALAVRVVMRFFAANSANGFVHWVYASSNNLLEPFRGVFHTLTVSHDHTIDFTALFVMAVYGVVALALLALADWLASVGMEK